MANAWTDVVSGAEAQSKPTFSAPIPGVADNYVLTQPFAQQLSAFVALALNTPHPDYPDYVLVEESEKQHLGGGDIRWTRKYAKVPAQHIEPSTYAYSFIGFLGRVNYDTSTGVITGTQHRERLSRTVFCKVQNDYALATSWADALTALPVIPAQEYFIHGSLDTPPYRVMTDFLLSVAGFTEVTVPTQDEYLTWITADEAAADSFHIVAEPSSLQRWMGNIFVRQTKYVKAI